MRRPSSTHRSVAVGLPAPSVLLQSALLLSALLLSALLLAVPAAALKKPVEPEELLNPLLGVEYSHWLVGPVYEMASGDEVEEYLLLASDDEAAAFIEAFWAKRNAGTPVFQDTPQQIFEQRAEEADKRYTEQAYPGRRSARGTVFIVFGEPKEITYESPRHVDDPTQEVWHYGKDAPPGLSGETPRKRYRFVEIDGQTVHYTGQRLRRRPGIRAEGRRF